MARRMLSYGKVCTSSVCYLFISFLGFFFFFVKQLPNVKQWSLMHILKDHLLGVEI